MMALSRRGFLGILAAIPGAAAVAALWPSTNRPFPRVAETGKLRWDWTPVTVTSEPMSAARVNDLRGALMATAPTASDLQEWTNAVCGRYDHPAGGPLQQNVTTDEAIGYVLRQMGEDVPPPMWIWHEGDVLTIRDVEPFGRMRRVPGALA